jgi:CRP/FNR family transcriptional regulator, cyclic AMP receptor protein
MISPELLRRYPFFGVLNDAQLKAVAMISEEEDVDEGASVFAESQPAGSFFLLATGAIDLVFTVEEEYKPELRKEFSVGEVNPGETFGISALIDPYQYTTTARANRSSHVIKVDAAQLRALLAEASALAARVMQQVAKTAMQRLSATRVQLAAAWA